MNFKDYLNTFPAIDHLAAIYILDKADTVVHQIAAQEGTLGSLRLYYTLAQKYHHYLNEEAARQGLIWYAEHLADAEANLGKHPNIDFLLKTIRENRTYRIQPISR